MRLALLLPSPWQPHCALLAARASEPLHPQGDLAGLDQSINLILRDSVERVWSSDKGMELVPSGGLSMLRGDSVAAVCELNADADAAMDWEAVKADAIPRLKP